jgi:hypothetical protein
MMNHGMPGRPAHVPSSKWWPDDEPRQVGRSVQKAVYWASVEQDERFNLALAAERATRGKAANGEQEVSSSGSGSSSSSGSSSGGRCRAVELETGGFGRLLSSQKGMGLACNRQHEV